MQCNAMQCQRHRSLQSLSVCLSFYVPVFNTQPSSAPHPHPAIQSGPLSAVPPLEPSPPQQTFATHQATRPRNSITDVVWFGLSVCLSTGSM